VYRSCIALTFVSVWWLRCIYFCNHLSVCVRVCVHYKHVCVRVRVSVWMCVYMCIIRIHIYIHTYIFSMIFCVVVRSVYVLAKIFIFFRCLPAVRFLAAHTLTQTQEVPKVHPHYPYGVTGVSSIRESLLYICTNVRNDKFPLF